MFVLIKSGSYLSDVHVGDRDNTLPMLSWADYDLLQQIRKERATKISAGGQPGSAQVIHTNGGAGSGGCGGGDFPGTCMEVGVSPAPLSLVRKERDEARQRAEQYYAEVTRLTGENEHLSSELVRYKQAIDAALNALAAARGRVK